MDDRGGMAEAVSHLIEAHGQRRIGFVRGPENHGGAQQRYQGYLDALGAHGLAVDPDLVTAPGTGTGIPTSPPRPSPRCSTGSPGRPARSPPRTTTWRLA